MQRTFHKNICSWKGKYKILQLITIKFSKIKYLLCLWKTLAQVPTPKLCDGHKLKHKSKKAPSEHSDTKDKADIVETGIGVAEEVKGKLQNVEKVIHYNYYDHSTYYVCVYTQTLQHSHCFNIVLNFLINVLKSQQWSAVMHTHKPATHIC